MPAGTAVGTVQAVDRDSPPFNSFYYSVDAQTIHGFVGVLSLDPVTGVLSTLKVLDREEKHVYNFNVQAGSSTDRQILRPEVSSAAVTVHIVDLNDNRPEFTFPNPSGGSKIAVFDQFPVGHTVTKLQAIDRDSSPECPYEVLDRRWETTAGHSMSSHRLVN